MNFRTGFLLLSIFVSNSLLANPLQDSSVISVDTLVSRISANQIQYNTLSQRAKMVWDDGNSEQEFAAGIRIRRDSLIWLSLTGAMGIEGARILVTSDSIRIINKLGNEYSVRDFSFLQSWILFPVSFNMLQQIMAGEKISISEKAALTTTEDSMYILYAETDKLYEKIWVNSQRYTIEKMLLKDKRLTQSMTITFDDYKPLGSRQFSHLRNIEVTREGIKMKLQIEITKVKQDEPLSYPFEINDKMKRVE